jgi:hypothetical protein
LEGCFGQMILTHSLDQWFLQLTVQQSSRGLRVIEGFWFYSLQNDQFDVSISLVNFDNSQS